MEVSNKAESPCSAMVNGRNAGNVARQGQNVAIAQQGTET